VIATAEGALLGSWVSVEKNIKRSTFATRRACPADRLQPSPVRSFQKTNRSRYPESL